MAGPIPLHRRVALPLAILLAGCAGRSPDPAAAPEPAAAADPYSTCGAAEPDPPGDPERCLRRVEASLLSAAAGRARRAGARLELLAPAGGTLAAFSDRAEEGDEFVRHRYGGWLAPVGQHVVLADLYEGGAVIAVDGDSGRSAELLGYPVASPDGEWVAAMNTDLVAAYTESGVQVWRVTAAGLELEWGLDGGGRWGGADPRWLDRRRLRFTFQTLDPATMQLLGRPATLRLHGDGFTLAVDE